MFAIAPFAASTPAALPAQRGSLAETIASASSLTTTLGMVAPLAFQYVDRVRVNTSTVGTGTLSLGTAISGFRAFGDALTAGALTSGSTVPYMIEDVGGTWEGGWGVYTDLTIDTLSRNVLENSSGTTTHLSLSGNAIVYITAFSAALVTAVFTSGTINNATIGNTTPAFGGFTTLAASSTVSGTGFTALVAPYLTSSTAAITYYLQSNPSNYITSAGAPVQSVFGRKGPIIMASTDVTTALGYTLANPSVPTNQGRNLLHNARFNVQQRGTGPWTIAAYTADRWLTSVSGDTISASIVTLTDADRIAIGDEFATSALQAVVTGAATAANYTVIQQKIEAVRTLSGKTVTVSFYAKASLAVNVGVNLQQTFGTGGSTIVIIGPTTLALTTIWTRYSVTFVVPSAAGQTFGTAGTDYTAFSLGLSSGTTYATEFGVSAQSGTFTFFGVQLEIGSTATNLEVRSYGSDLALCQRFYQVGVLYGDTSVVSGQNFLVSSYLPVQMRINPTITLTSTAGSYAISGIAGGANVAQEVYAYGASTASGTQNVLIAYYTASADF